MTVDQLQMSWLSRNRGQAPSHIWTVLDDRPDSLGQLSQYRQFRLGFNRGNHLKLG